MQDHGTEMTNNRKTFPINFPTAFVFQCVNEGMVLSKRNLLNRVPLLIQLRQTTGSSRNRKQGETKQTNKITTDRFNNYQIHARSNTLTCQKNKLSLRAWLFGTPHPSQLQKF